MAQRIRRAASSMGAASTVNWSTQILSIYTAPTTELARKIVRHSYKDFAPTEHVPFVTFVQLRLHIHQFREEFRG